MARQIEGHVSTHFRMHLETRDTVDFLLAHLKYHGVTMSREELLNLLAREWVAGFASRYPDIPLPEVR